AYRILTANPKVPRDTPQLHALRSFEYEKTSVFTHTDSTLLPRDRGTWRSINIAVSAERSSGKKEETGEGKGFRNQPMASIWMNHMQNHFSGTEDVFQTVNPLVFPDPASTLTSSWFERVIVTNKSMAGLNDLDLEQGTNNIWFVGSYAYPGIPLLEGCAVSAKRVAEALGAPAPWEAATGRRRNKYGLGDGQVRGKLRETYFSVGVREDKQGPAFCGRAFDIVLKTTGPLLCRCPAPLWMALNGTWIAVIAAFIWSSSLLCAVIARVSAIRDEAGTKSKLKVKIC
ncbi:MAG: hypothetical protein BJ554DRAFT_3781, partial [Olpidium bornovanus]